MTLNWQTPGGSFRNKLYELLKALEAPTLSAVNVNGNLTIGLGFDLRMGKESLKEKVLDVMGVIPGALQNQRARDIEQGYRDRLAAAFLGTSVQALNDIMQERRNNTDPDYLAALPAANRREAFAFADLAEVEDVYHAVIHLYEEDVATAWSNPAFMNGPGFKESRERIAPASIPESGADRECLLSPVRRISSEAGQAR